MEATDYVKMMQLLQQFWLEEVDQWASFKIWDSYSNSWVYVDMSFVPIGNPERYENFITIKE